MQASLNLLEQVSETYSCELLVSHLWNICNIVLPSFTHHYRKHFYRNNSLLVKERNHSYIKMLLPFIITVTSIYHNCYFRLSYLLLPFIRSVTLFIISVITVYDMLLPFIISATSVYHICYYRLSYLLLLFIIYVTSVYHICYFCLSYLLFPFIISVTSVYDICYIPTLKWMFLSIRVDSTSVIKLKQIWKWYKTPNILRNAS
jgi:hypothetical protein